MQQILLELDMVSTSETGQSLLEAKETGAMISLFLHKQKKLKRQIFIRRYWYGDAICMIARRFSISESKVKTTLYRTRQQLKHYLVKEGVYNEG